ncbi:MAG: VWA domain-containing protein, partial [Chloroflexota bacterium]|nr:VWA domain-containing protein [Chloroflexota bacterium]
MTGWTPDRRDLREAGEGIAARDRLLARAARYSRWDGSQAVPDLEADEILDALADDVMAEGDIEAALRRLIERGWRSGDPSRRDLAGLQDLVERIQRRREELLDRYKLGDVLADVRQELEGIVAEERAGVERRLESASQDGSEAGAAPEAGDQGLRDMLRDVAAKRLDQLDALPPDVGGRIRGLEEYDFLEPGARQRFEDLVQKLRKQVLDQYVAGLSEAIQGITPEDLAANREMVRDLNQLLQERLAGRDPDASEFIDKHGRFFPGARDLDDIIAQLAERMAAMQSLLRSMTPEQRAELQAMTDALLRDDRLRWDLAQLAATMDQLMPGVLGDRFRFGGDKPMGLEGALEQIARLQALDSLEDALGDVDAPGDLADLDRDRV